jgi:hypothetical protein
VGLGWREIPVPVIAAVHGVAFGGGLQVALGADIRLVTADLKMSVMEIKWGLVPDMAGVVLMRGLVRATTTTTYTAHRQSSPVCTAAASSAAPSAVNALLAWPPGCVPTRWPRPAPWPRLWPSAAPVRCAPTSA